MSRKLISRIILVFLAATLLTMSTFVYRTGALGAGGYASLQWCTLRGWNRVATILLMLGAPPSPSENMIDWYYLSSLTDTPLHTAIKREDVALLDSLLRHGAIVDWCCCSCVTPLHEAIVIKNRAIVEKLLDAGANTSIKYDLKLSALELSKVSGTPEITRIIAMHNQAEQKTYLNLK